MFGKEKGDLSLISDPFDVRPHIIFEVRMPPSRAQNASVVHRNQSSDPL
jgi:hypothetical protein